MNRLLLLFPLLLAFALADAAAQDPKAPNDPQWSLLALHIEKAGLPGEGLSSTDYRQGTRLTASFQLPGRVLVGIDTKKSKVERFTDDKNTDLLKDPVGVRFVSRESVSDPHLSKDGKHGSVVFQGPGWPAAGASKVRVKGAVTVVVGKDEKEIEKKDASLRVGVDLGVGTLKLELPRLGKGDSYVSYQGNRPLKQIAFLDGDGKEITHRQYSSYSPDRAAAKSPYVSRIHPNVKGLDRCTVRVTYFDGVEEIMVPVDLEAGPGL